MIVSEASRPTRRLSSLQPSGRRYQSLRSRSTRLTNSFVHQAGRKLNPPLPLSVHPPPNRLLFANCCYSTDCYFALLPSQISAFTFLHNLNYIILYYTGIYAANSYMYIVHIVHIDIIDIEYSILLYFMSIFFNISNVLLCALQCLLLVVLGYVLSGRASGFGTTALVSGPPRLRPPWTSPGPTHLSALHPPSPGGGEASVSRPGLTQPQSAERAYFLS